MTTAPMASLYLSRLALNPRSRQVMSEIAHPYEMHRTLLHSFPKASDDARATARQEFGVLFRAEVNDARGAVNVYVQSRVEPNWSFLDGLNDYLRTDTEMPGYEYKDIMPACRKIQNGQVLSFRLRANPTKRIAKHDDKMRGKRIELRSEEEQIAWLTRKGQESEHDVPGGFELLTKKVEDEKGETRLVARVNASCEGKRTGCKRDGTRGHATHWSVHFEGLLRVTDRDALLETLVGGIGSAKAYGFGLLSVAPVGR